MNKSLFKYNFNKIKTLLTFCYGLTQPKVEYITLEPLFLTLFCAFHSP